MSSVTERFLRYVSFDTMSDEASPTCPSTAKQKLLGAAIVEEMKEMGISDAFMDENGYVYGTVPGDPNLPTIGLIAHMDTSPDASGANIKARIVEYTGGDICLNEEKGIFLSAKDYPSLNNHVGKHLIVTDGTTLLGIFRRFCYRRVGTAPVGEMPHRFPVLSQVFFDGPDVRLCQLSNGINAHLFQLSLRSGSNQKQFPHRQGPHFIRHLFREQVKTSVPGI